MSNYMDKSVNERSLLQHFESNMATSHSDYAIASAQECQSKMCNAAYNASLTFLSLLWTRKVSPFLVTLYV